MVANVSKCTKCNALGPPLSLCQNLPANRNFSDWTQEKCSADHVSVVLWLTWQSNRTSAGIGKTWQNYGKTHWHIAPGFGRHLDLGVLHRKRKHVIGPWALLGIAWYRLIETSKLQRSPEHSRAPNLISHVPDEWLTMMSQPDQMSFTKLSRKTNHSATVQATRPVRCSNPLQSLGQLPTGLAAARKWKCHMSNVPECAGDSHDTTLIHTLPDCTSTRPCKFMAANASTKSSLDRPPEGVSSTAELK